MSEHGLAGRQASKEITPLLGEKEGGREREREKEGLSLA
jgi:hypothetical protein